MTLFCSPAVLLCLLAMVDPAAACFPLFLPKTLALPSFHCFSHLFHCYCFIVFPQNLGTANLSLFFSHLFHCYCLFILAKDPGISFPWLFFSHEGIFPAEIVVCVCFAIPFYPRTWHCHRFSFFVILSYFTLAAFFSYALKKLIFGITRNTWNV